MKILISFIMVFMAMSAQAQWIRQNNNIKLPTQEVLEHEKITAPIAAGTTNVLSAHAGATAAAPVTVTTFVAQPDFARNLVVTPVGTTADVAAGDVVITGLDANGKVISESFTFAANASTAVTGNKAFKSITSILIPAEDSPFGATWSVGFGAKLGLKRCLAGAGYLLHGLVDGVALTGMTVAANASSSGSNTVIPNPAPDGTRVFDFLYIQNFACK